MQFYWKPNRRPGIAAEEGESEMLAQFLAVEIGLSRVMAQFIMSELREDPALEWIGDEMQFRLQDDVTQISSQYAEEAPPDPVPLAVFIAALKTWDAYVRKGVSDERHTFRAVSD